MKRGRKPKYNTETERINAFKKARNDWMTSTSWVCDVCNKEFKMWSKTNHLRTKTHTNKSR